VEKINPSFWNTQSFEKASLYFIVGRVSVL
jgi:hypothetical protein